MPTQAERTATTHRRLLEAAVELFAAKGYQSTTVAEIGARVGQSRGAVTLHFGSKDGLLSAIVEILTDEWEEGAFLPSLEEGAGSLEDAIDAALRAHRTALEEDPTFFALYDALLYEAIGPASPIRADFAALHRRLRERIAQHIETGQKEGLVQPDVDPEGLAIWLLGSLRGIVHQYLIESRALDLDAAYAELRRAMLARLVVTGGPQAPPPDAG
ncbi:TetR family transcriptional regulator [Actinomadura sp. 21ATH]|uniref:TetR family transcriptional regulator n=1 Tax=Actinomadura sp. 21ATH TaxID=1735444 RepID=UPI0035C1F7F0